MGEEDIGMYVTTLEKALEDVPSSTATAAAAAVAAVAVAVAVAAVVVVVVVVACVLSTTQLPL